MRTDDDHTVTDDTTDETISTDDGTTTPPPAGRPHHRYRGATAIAAGGIAAATVGALLGGLGAGTPVAPAAVQSLLTSDAPSLPNGILPSLPGALPTLPGGQPSFPGGGADSAHLVSGVSGNGAARLGVRERRRRDCRRLRLRRCDRPVVTGDGGHRRAVALDRLVDDGDDAVRAVRPRPAHDRRPRPADDRVARPADDNAAGPADVAGARAADDRWADLRHDADVAEQRQRAGDRLRIGDDRIERRRPRCQRRDERRVRLRRLTGERAAVP